MSEFRKIRRYIKVSRLAWSWTLLIAATIVALAIAYQIANSDGFALTEVLTLVLSVFAIWLSMSFYHKAAETSNRFYQESLRYLNDISSTLAEMRSTFNEQIRALQERTKDVFDRVTPAQTTKDSESARQDVEQEKEALQEQLKVEQKEKEEIKKRMHELAKGSEDRMTDLIEKLVKAQKRIVDIEQREAQLVLEKRELEVLGRFTEDAKQYLINLVRSSGVGAVEFALRKGGLGMWLLSLPVADRFHLETLQLVDGNKWEKGATDVIQVICDRLKRENRAAD